MFTKYNDLTAYRAAADKGAIPASYGEAMLLMLRRGLEVSSTSVRAYFTFARFLEIAAPSDGSPGFDAWTCGEMRIAGKLVEFAVYIGRVHGASDFTRALRKARNLIAEVIENGSRAATLIGDGFDAAGHRTLVYCAQNVAVEAGTTAMVDLAARHRITFSVATEKAVDAPTKVAPSRRSKGSKLAFEAAA